MNRFSAATVLGIFLFPHSSYAADPIAMPLDQSAETVQAPPTLSGRAAAVSGDTIWFPLLAVSVRLAGIEACPLPQWTFDPTPHPPAKGMAPVPCGAFAKAWLKRQIGDSTVRCVSSGWSVASLTAVCTSRGRDLGYEMLRVGLARTASGPTLRGDYRAAERYAKSARYGVWGTYALDFGEWNELAVDRTLERRPIADQKILSGRKIEFTPPFADWRHRPIRKDR